MPHLKPLAVPATASEGESLFGIIVNFCGQNRLTPVELAAALGMQKLSWTCLVTRREWASTLARVTGLARKEIERRQILPQNSSQSMLRLGGKFVPADMVDLVYRRIAPSTYRRTGRHAVSWLNKATRLDEITQEELIWKCREGHMQTWVSTTELGQCAHCGLSLLD